MNLIAFLEQWANPTGWVRIFSESYYPVALNLIGNGTVNWDTLLTAMTPEYSFNSRAFDCFALLPKSLHKCKVTHFVFTSDRALIVFTDLKKTKNNS